jgi:hypothetical protein
VKKSKLFKIAVIFFFVIVLSLLYAQLKANAFVASFLERKIPPHLTLAYETSEVNLFYGSIEFSKINLKIRDRDSTLNHTLIDIENIDLQGFSYSQFFFNNTFEANEIYFNGPNVKYFPSKTFRQDSSKPKGVVKLLKDIIVGKIVVNNGNFQMGHKSNESNQLRADNINFSLTNGRTDPEIIKQKIPLSYDTYDFSAEQIFFDLGKFETLEAQKLRVTETNAQLDTLTLRSKYSKKKLSRLIDTELDHIDLTIPKSKLHKINFGFKKDRFFFESEIGEMNFPVLKLYRDKVKLDNRTRKKMYSQLLRELPFDLKIDSVFVKDATLAYEEQTTYKTPAGRIFFDNINLTVENLSNFETTEKRTLAKIRGKLMGVSPITLSYDFDVKNRAESFKLKATLFNIKGSDINPFLQPNANAKVEGDIDELYLTTSGNAVQASGQMKMKYKNLKFKILRKDRLRINRLLSAIGNIFTNDGSDTDAFGYRYGTIDVERDPTKSFFNYVWISTQDGLLSTIVGNGKKE